MYKSYVYVVQSPRNWKKKIATSKKKPISLHFTPGEKRTRKVEDNQTEIQPQSANSLRVFGERERKRKTAFNVWRKKKPELILKARQRK